VEPDGKGYLDAYLTALALAKPPATDVGESASLDLADVQSRVVVTDAPLQGHPAEIVIGRERLRLL
jgi:hypothetical protein